MSNEMEMNEQSYKESYFKKFSVIEAEAFRIRSLSFWGPSIDEIEYRLDFVPKLKPKKHDTLPSPMNLNAKCFKNLKKNRQCKFLLDMNQIYLSCPEKDDIDSDSTEETLTSKANCPFERACIETKEIPKEEIRVQKKNSSKKFMEDEKLKITKKSPFCHEYETILKKESTIIFDKFDLYFNEEDNFDLTKNRCKLSFNSKKKSLLNEGAGISTSGTPVANFCNEEEYSLLKSLSHNFSDSFRKTRANSILRMLEINVDEKRKTTFCEDC